MRSSEQFFQRLTQSCAIALIVLVLGIALEMCITAIPAMQQFGLGFLVTTEWNPVQDVYGILPQIYGTLVSALVSLALALPLGVAIAIFLHEDIAPRWLRVPLSFVVELLAAIPSVVYGLWGIFVLIPAILPISRQLHQKFGWLPWFNTLPGQRGMLPTILVLILMILPIIVALSRDALAAQSSELRQGAAALGATRWEIIVQILLPASFSGIVGSAVLALGRALGETMAAVMLIGNANQINASLLAPASTIAALIASQFSEARRLQLSALLYAALVLMGLTLAINVFAQMLMGAMPQWPGWTGRSRRDPPPSSSTREQLHPPQSPLKRERQEGPLFKGAASAGALWRPDALHRRGLTWMGNGVCLLATGIVVVAIASLLYSLLTRGLTRFDLAAFTQLPPPPLDLGGGFRNATIGTLIMVGLGAIVSAPIGIGIAIYLVEVAPAGQLAQWVRFFNGVLSGIPSILCGLFIYGLVVLTTGRFSAVAGGLALAVVMLPLTVRASEEALKAVPQEWRDGAIALGATTPQTVSFVVLPAARPAIATGIILATARAAGETAPLLFTALFSQYGFNGAWNPVASLSVLIYNFALSPYPNHQALAWTAALVVVGFLLGISILARYFTRDRQTGFNRG